jgi:hypothetical protein
MPHKAVADQIHIAESGTATTLLVTQAVCWQNDTDAEKYLPPCYFRVSNGTLTFNGNGTFSYVHNGSELPPIVLPINQ